MSDGAWHELIAGAERSASAGRAAMQAHHPSVAVLACSDARVPPSVVFDQPAGELFVVRLAGNTASPSAVASLEYAVDHLGVELIVVLGHTHCGAVAAAVDGACDGSLSAVVAPICSVAERAGCTDPEMLSRLNVASTMRDIATSSPAIGPALQDGRVVIRGAVYDMVAGDIIDVDCLDDAVDTPTPH